MRKPTYYLWRNDFSTQEEFEEVKEKYRNFGFRVVSYFDGRDKNSIHDGLKAIIKNHLKEVGE
ncbi:hypothetical protein [Frisingicoccus sp.]|uniref:hypothetical protein n=1 Tax=Frisingicoccus sp. TaxID=1918627 RepID=UPI003AB6248E